MKNKNLIIAVLLLVIVAVGSFYCGMKYQAKNAPTFNRQFASGQFDRQGGMQRSVNGQSRVGFRPVNGEIIAVDDKSITVKMVDGSSKIVIIGDKTEINKANIAKKEDLQVGEKVAVFGAENSDGSVTAQNIQLNPIIRGLYENPGK